MPARPYRLAIVHNFATHYTKSFFELVARRYDADVFFHSNGGDWYWLPQHGVRAGDFRHRYLPGIRIAGTRITPTLPFELLRGDYDAYVCSLNGRFALPSAYAAARIRRRPFVLWTGIWHRIATPAQRAAFPLTRALYRHADSVIGYGEHVRRYVISEGADPERVHVAPHAVPGEPYGRFVEEAERAEVKAKLGLPEGASFLLYVGRLEKAKGIDLLIRTLRTVAGDHALVIAGDGAERRNLEGLVAGLGLTERVRFAGYVAQEGTVALYSAARACIVPSITTAAFKEPWGLVVNEAFAQGCPVIASDAVGAAAGGMVRDGENGFVVPEGSVDALANALSRVVRDDALHTALSRAARETAAGWTQERMLEGFARGVDAAIERAGRAR